MDMRKFIKLLPSSTHNYKIYTRSIVLVGMGVFSLSGLVFAGGSPEVEAHCDNISRQYQAAAMFRENAISEEDALRYMEKNSDEKLRQGMQIAIVLVYENYPQNNSGEIRLISYNRCIADNTPSKVPVPSNPNSKPLADKDTTAQLLDGDGNIDIGNAPSYVGDSPAKLITGQWVCTNDKKLQWKEVYRSNGRFQSNGPSQAGEGTYIISNDVATRKYDHSAGDKYTLEDERILLHFTSPNSRVSNLDKRYSECSRAL